MESTYKTWPLKCPDCGDLTFVDLPVKPEPGHTGTVQCARGHAFIYQYDGATVDVVGAPHVRGRYKG
jgi:hypothetical protein